MLLLIWSTKGVIIMWFWKNKKSRLTTKYDAMEESQKRMKIFEEKYHIHSVDVYNKACDMTVFEGTDKYLWETYIRNFIHCGGSFDDAAITVDEFEDCFECSALKNEMKKEKINNDIKKETTRTSFLFLFVQNM